VSSALPSLARAFKKRGYRTVCIHPYPASFYQRDKIFNLLGFDEFIDLKSFAQAAPHDKAQGPYVSDQVLTDKILETLDRQDEQPLFIFAITMENHGPLHLERITSSEEQKWLSKPLPQDCQELAIYLRHLANADQMVLRLLRRFSAPLVATQDSSISSYARPVQLLWYGDHVPVLANVYAQFGFPEGNTDYFLWRSDTLRESAIPTSQHTHRLQTMHVHQLALELLK
jgi:phosphoglycerol transferase MdoB-like AlkP superfamily enzyme